MQSLPDIPAGGSAAATWIVRGDTAGDYELAATYAASLEPIGAPISMVARTAPGSLRVWGGDALTMRVLAEERLLDGHPYRVVVEMTNVSDIPVYNLAVELKEEGKLNYIYQPREELTRSVAELAPGETLRADYVLVPTVGIYTPLVLLEEISFVKKTGGDVEVATEIVSVPPRYADADRPAISLRREGSDVVVTWAAVPGATELPAVHHHRAGDRLRRHADRHPAGRHDVDRAAADGCPRRQAPGGQPDGGRASGHGPPSGGRARRLLPRVGRRHRRPSSAWRSSATAWLAGLAGTDACGRSADGFAAARRRRARRLRSRPRQRGLRRCGRGERRLRRRRTVARRRVRHRRPGAAGVDHPGGRRGPVRRGRWRTGRRAGRRSAPRTSASTGILGQCGCGCDTRWRATAQAVLRDRVYPRVYENLRALRLAHPSAVVVAFAPPTPVAAGSGCALFGTSGGITAAESRFLADELYPWLQTTLRRAAINAGVNIVDVTTALEGHQACDRRAVGGGRGDRRRRRCQQRLVPADGGWPRRHRRRARWASSSTAPATCCWPTRRPPVLRVLAPQEEAPFVVPVTAAPGRCLHGDLPGAHHGARSAQRRSHRRPRRRSRAAAVERRRRPRRHGRRDRPGAGARRADTRRGRGVQHRPQPDRLDRRDDRRGRRPPTGRRRRMPRRPTKTSSP